MQIDRHAERLAALHARLTYSDGMAELIAGLIRMCSDYLGHTSGSLFRSIRLTPGAPDEFYYAADIHAVVVTFIYALATTLDYPCVFVFHVRPGQEAAIRDRLAELCRRPAGTFHVTADDNVEMLGGAELHIFLPQQAAAN